MTEEFVGDNDELDENNGTVHELGNNSSRTRGFVGI